MKKVSLLSKAEMKKVVGGHPDTPYCMVDMACHSFQFGVSVSGTCVMSMQGSTILCGCSSGSVTSNHREGDGCWGFAPVES